MNDILFSIIVPVFNIPYHEGKNLLKRCFESLQEQSYKNIEIIIVNDGSTDCAVDFCEGFVKSDTRFILINQTNKGIAEARNVGLKKAKGDYVIFVDSDDQLELESCSILNSLILKNPDVEIIACNISILNKNKKTVRSYTNPHPEVSMSGYEFIKMQLTAKTLHASIWCCVIKKSFLQNNNLFFSSELFVVDDVHLKMRALLIANHVLVSDHFHYIHTIRDMSTSRKKDQSKYVEHGFRALYDFEALYLNITDDELKLLLMNHLVTQFFYAFMLGNSYPIKYLYIFDRKFLMNKANTSFNKFLVFLFSLNPRICYSFLKIYPILSKFGLIQALKLKKSLS